MLGVAGSGQVLWRSDREGCVMATSVAATSCAGPIPAVLGLFIKRASRGWRTSVCIPLIESRCPFEHVIISVAMRRRACRQARDRYPRGRSKDQPSATSRICDVLPWASTLSHAHGGVLAPLRFMQRAEVPVRKAAASSAIAASDGLRLQKRSRRLTCMWCSGERVLITMLVSHSNHSYGGRDASSVVGAKVPMTAGVGSAGR